jgi:CheY-like chemotaxis protein
MNTNQNEKNERLLWIDDEFSTLPWLLSQLRALVGESNLITVRTSKDAQKILRQQDSFQCVLLDIMLPRDKKELYDEQVRLDEGITLLEKLKSGGFPAFPLGTPIVVFTARGNGKALERIQNLLITTNDRLIRKAIDHLDDVLSSVKQGLRIE